MKTYAHHYSGVVLYGNVQQKRVLGEYTVAGIGQFAAVDAARTKRHLSAAARFVAIIFATDDVFWRRSILCGRFIVCIARISHKKAIKQPF